jgi:hypothetical protein
MTFLHFAAAAEMRFILYWKCLPLFTGSSSVFSVRSVMHKYLEKKNEVNFDKIFNQVLGEYLCNMASLQKTRTSIESSMHQFIIIS